VKKIRIRSAVPIYLAALVWIIMGLAAPIYEWLYMLVTAGISVAVYLFAGVFFPGREVEQFDPVATGNAEIDKQIREGQATLKKIVEANKAIEDEEISACLDRMAVSGEKVFEALRETPGKATQVHTFMRYYLPTAEKLLGQYQTLMSTASQGENVQEAIDGIKEGVSLIAVAFEKQLDSLYKNENLDIQTDIDVLETMLKKDGFIN